MNVDFVTAIKVYFANYANFKGRSTRAEYWWAMLFVYLLTFVISFLQTPILQFLVSLGLLLPNWAIQTRRFHDIGKSGWWVVFFTVAGLVIVGATMGGLLFSIMQNANNPQVIAASIQGSYGKFSIGIILSLALAIWSLIWLVTPSGPDNQYGPNPYGDEQSGEISE